MEKKIKESVGTLLAHIIKIDKRDLEKEAPLFCDIMGQNFDCNPEEAKTFLHDIMEKDYDLDKHVEIINQALADDKLSKYHLLEQLNHIIYSDKISEEDYRIFENIKERLFPS
ncbi:TerB family tellurite resistance protein [Sulfurovum sp. ST-21]|uniref:Co-chaperone DjlA N-terminal domain-containing protein n=1 Tax=Sulfurovum indicum TaxID=2779528 RepID=A0A7M1S4N7_9BACT|nr:TerB family tellurite resistance protein [Sulfurovum indicum]QOR62154.1 hypothetical protein IMZ28_01350 [Sulfurovum indicum]